MTDAKYEVIGKCFDGIDIIGFMIRREDGSTKLVNTSDVVRLAKGKKLKNASCVLDSNIGEYVLDIEEGEHTLNILYKNSKTKITLYGRIVDENNKCIGYKAIDNDKNRLTLTSKKVWELAFNKNIVGVKAVETNGIKALVSTDGFELKSLPKIKN